MWVVIPESELEINFTRSSGPGGQNVNKTSTKAQLRWDLWSSQVLTMTQKHRLAEKLAHRLTQEGYLLVESNEQRSQLQNKQQALRRLQELVTSALKPETPRIPTTPTTASRQQRRHQKIHHSRLKQTRKTPETD